MRSPPPSGSADSLASHYLEQRFSDLNEPRNLLGGLVRLQILLEQALGLSTSNAAPRAAQAAGPGARLDICPSRTLCLNLGISLEKQNSGATCREALPPCSLPLACELGDTPPRISDNFLPDPSPTPSGRLSPPSQPKSECCVLAVSDPL